MGTVGKRTNEEKTNDYERQEVRYRNRNTKCLLAEHCKINLLNLPEHKKYDLHLRNTLTFWETRSFAFFAKS